MNTLDCCSNTGIEQIVGVRTRQINRALRGVEELTDTSENLLLIESEEEDDE